MLGFFKKLLATGTVLTIGLTNVAFTDTIFNPPPPPIFGGDSVCGAPYGGPCGPCGPCSPCGSWCDNISFYGSWLYWKVNGDEFDYAVEKTRVQNDFVRDHETIHNLRFDWDSGFRLGAGVEFPCLCWGLDVIWTHYESSSSKSKRFDGTQGTTQTFVSLPAVFNFGDTLEVNQSANFTGRLKFRYNTVDFEFSRWCCCNGCVTFRPHIGIRIADIQEGFHDKVFFNGGAMESFSDTLATDGRFFAKNRFKGAGVRAGLDLDLCLCEGWSFIGRGAASIVWGRTRLTQHFKYTTAAVANFYHGDINDNYRQSRVITDLSFGIRYKTLACCCYPVFVELDWEHHYLFNQHRFWVDNSFYPEGEGGSTPLLTTSSWKKNGSLALQGVTLTVGICF
jgi:hypothetical protein